MTSGKRGFYASAAIRGNDGGMRGVVVIKKDLDEMASLFHAYPGAFLVDPNGVILVSSKKEWVFCTMAPLGGEALRRVRASRQFGEGRFAQAPVSIRDYRLGGMVYMEGRRYHVSASPIGPDGWSLLLFSDLERVGMYRSVGVAATCLLLTLLVSSIIVMFLREGAVEEIKMKNEQLAEALRRTEEAEKAEREMQSQLLHAQKLESVGRLAAGIAHEINTPIQFIGDNTRFLKDAFSALSDLIQRCRGICADSTALDGAERERRLQDALREGEYEYLAAEVPKAVGQSLEGVQRVAAIVRAMKDFSHPDQTEKALADLNRAIETTVTVARNEWRQVADMKLELEPLLPSVPCFLGDVNQVLLNLIVNAAHAIAAKTAGDGAKGVITVSTRCDGDHVEIRIADTGTGIPERHRAHVFDPFFTTKELGKGTGQGLSLSHNIIVKKHGGVLTFETEEGKGTTFIIRLPM